MNKRIFCLSHATARRLASEAIHLAPEGWIVTVQEPARNLEQNAAMWSKLADISEQVDWYGQRLTPEDWKAVFSASLKKQKVVPGLDGGFVVCGQSTSKMGKREFSDLLELITAFASERGVRWSDDFREAA